MSDAQTTVEVNKEYLRPYSKYKLELKSNLSEILPVNYWFIPWIYPNLI